MEREGVGKVITKLIAYPYKCSIMNTNYTGVSTMFWKFKVFYAIKMSLIAIRKD